MNGLRSHVLTLAVGTGHRHGSGGHGGEDAARAGRGPGGLLAWSFGVLIPTMASAYDRKRFALLALCLGFLQGCGGDKSI